MLQPAAWAHSSSPLYHLARVLSVSNSTSEVLALSRCINTGPRKSQNSTRCRALLLRRFTGMVRVLQKTMLRSVAHFAKVFISLLGHENAKKSGQKED